MSTCRDCAYFSESHLILFFGLCTFPGKDRSMEITFVYIDKEGGPCFLPNTSDVSYGTSRQSDDKDTQHTDNDCTGEQCEVPGRCIACK